MNVLLVSATPFEIAPTLAFLEKTFEPAKEGGFIKNGVSVSALITGVGSALTCWHLGRQLAARKPDWIIHGGIAGALDPVLALGDVVQVMSEQFADLGVEEADGRFTDLFELGLVEPNGFPYINGVLYNPAARDAAFLPSVKGITVNKVHGSARSIDAVRQKYPQAQMESMEGAAVFFSCLSCEIPFAAIRSISNYVEPRNREAWEIALAIDNLNKVLIDMLESLIPPVP